MSRLRAARALLGNCVDDIRRAFAEKPAFTVFVLALGVFYALRHPVTVSRSIVEFWNDYKTPSDPRVSRQMSENESGNRELLARAYDDVNDEHIADLYAWEAVDQLKDSWWVRIEEVN